MAKKPTTKKIEKQKTIETPQQETIETVQQVSEYGKPEEIFNETLQKQLDKAKEEFKMSELDIMRQCLIKEIHIVIDNYRQGTTQRKRIMDVYNKYFQENKDVACDTCVAWAIEKLTEISDSHRQK